MTENKIAAALLEIAAIKLRPHEPFKWASGWNSPIYCDNRLSLSFPKVRDYIKEAIVKAIRENFAGAEGIAGVATAGIPQGALAADAMSLPFIYVRPKPKEHGMANLIEGKIIRGQKIVVIEDLISTGGSSLKAVEALKESGFDVLGMVAIFTYGFKVAEDNFNKAGVKLIALSNYDILIEEAIKTKYAKIADLASLKTWRQDPANWMRDIEP
jgi:orotate phosphoribosyltransferase